MDAVFKVIDRVCKVKGELRDYRVDAVTEGKDALARVVVKVAFEEGKPAITGHGLSVDTMLATANAYIGALNSYLSLRE
jgi:2-isopropylmalate synthase